MGSRVHRERDASAEAPEVLVIDGMVGIPGGTFRMGSDKHYPEEAPVHHVAVDGFWIDATPVTNRDFRKFVNATGYITFAEMVPAAKDYPGALPHMLKQGSSVFTPPKHTVDVRDWSQWWIFKFGANWRRPVRRVNGKRPPQKRIQPTRLKGTKQKRVHS